jgi:alpha-1,4-digalacturonate transport system substrate-binding protein
VRVTNLGGLSEYWLDMRPYLSNPDYWETNFGPFLDWMRPAGSNAIPGFMTQLTVTGPFINRTLFDQAGIAGPEGRHHLAGVGRGHAQVAEATGTPFAMVMDRTGHRLAGPAISQGASFFGEDGHATIDDEGMRDDDAAHDRLARRRHHAPRHLDRLGRHYVAGNEFFINAQVVLYMSGSWQVGQFANLIGDAFDWEVIPNPCGPMACTGMPGGAGVVGVANTDHPAEVARVMEFLAQEDVLAEFYGRTLFIPGHLGLAETGHRLPDRRRAGARRARRVRLQVPRLDPTAYAMQAYPFNFVVFDSMRDRLTQAFVGELTLDEVLERAQADIDETLREQGIR